jgi:hypothetical protein
MSVHEERRSRGKGPPRGFGACGERPVKALGLRASDGWNETGYNVAAMSQGWGVEVKAG